VKTSLRVGEALIGQHGRWGVTAITTDVRHRRQLLSALPIAGLRVPEPTIRKVSSSPVETS